MGSKHTILYQAVDVASGKSGQMSSFPDLDPNQFYYKLGDKFGYPPEDILFCTVNTPMIDMEALWRYRMLLVESNTIYVHRKRLMRNVEIVKRHDFIGLTFTDNGNGTVIIKDVRSDALGHFQVGEGVASINGTSLNGWHYERAAEFLSSVRIDKKVKIVVFEPLRV